MKTSILILCVAFCGTTAIHADDITLKNGRVLKNAELAGTDIDTVRIRHDDGIARIEAGDLPDNLKEKWSMKPEQVEQRRQDRDEQNKLAREASEKRARDLRNSLSESEKIPRYMQPSEVFTMFSVVGGIQPVEAQYMALKWNIAEANRVGLPDQAQQFMSQLALLEPQMQKIIDQRREALKQWDDMTQKMDQLAKQSQTEANQLKQQIGQLQSELNESKQNTRTIITGPPIYYNPYPPVIYPPRPPRPLPPPIIRVNKTSLTPIQPAPPMRPLPPRPIPHVIQGRH